MSELPQYMSSFSSYKQIMSTFDTIQKILLDCDQSNVLLAPIIFFCILLKAFSFLSAYIRNRTNFMVQCIILPHSDV